MGRSRKARRILLIGSLVITYWIASQIYWFLRTRPRGISSTEDYFARFGDPSSVRKIQVGGMDFYEFYVHAPRYLLLLPVSSPPCFVFDDSGRFMDWSPNPVNDHTSSGHWPSGETVTVSVSEIRQRLGP
jgi:hypothetical protein